MFSVVQIVNKLEEIYLRLSHPRQLTNPGLPEQRSADGTAFCHTQRQLHTSLIFLFLYEYSTFTSPIFLSGATDIPSALDVQFAVGFSAHIRSAIIMVDVPNLFLGTIRVRLATYDFHYAHTL
jgi:hypothetical protein